MAADTDTELSTWIVADDHALVRSGIVMQLQSFPWLQLVGEAGDGEEALQLILEKRPDLALLDLRMPARSGIEVVEELAKLEIETRVVIGSAFNDPAIVRRALDAGAWGFVDKASDAAVLVGALRSVMEGIRFVDPALASSVLTQESIDLSDGEHRILQHLANGLSNAEIAQELDLGVETVKTYVSRILRKLDADSRTDAVAQGLRRAIIE